MKKQLIFSATLVALCGACSMPVHATDIATKTPAAAAVLDPWTGTYIGINGGYGFDLRQGVAAGQVATIADLNAAPQGFLGGVHGGIGTRFGSYFYIGAEADIDGAALTGSATAPGLITANSKNTWLMSARARVGVIPFGHLMFYGTAGYGAGGGEFTIADIAGHTASVNPTLSGFTWGGGLEFQVTGNWLGRVEYLQYDFGNVSVATPAAAFSLKDRVDVFRGGLSYKF